MEEKITDRKKRGRPAKSAASGKARKTSRTKRQQGDTIFALDIGTRTVIGILAEKTSDGYKIIDMETAAHEKRSMTDGQIEDIEAVAEVIKSVKAALEKRRSIKLSHVCIAAAGRALKTLRCSAEYMLSPNKAITAEELKAAELEAVRKTEESFSSQYETTAFYCVGHSVISLTLDGYKVQKPEGHRGERLETEIIAAFLPAYVVESLCAAVDMAGLDVSGLTLEPIAAMNVIVPPELRLINVALCDIGAGTSDVAISSGGSVVAYEMATVAGDEITEALMKKLLVDFPTAERIKTSCDEEISYTDILLMPQTITAKRVRELLEPAAQELADTICTEILSANSEPPQAVFLVGGGSKLKGLDELVAKGLRLDPTRVVTGRRELMRGIAAPKNMEIGAEHATPLGIAVTASEGVSYDFTTITLNGRKIRTLDTNRLTVFELLSFGGIKPDKLIGKSGSSLTFTINGERITLRGTPASPAQIIVNGKPSALNATVRKGDEVTVIPAEDGENAAAYLSDYFTAEQISGAISVRLFGDEVTAGEYVSVNSAAAVRDSEIENGDSICVETTASLGELLEKHNVHEAVLLNGQPADMSTPLCSGDVIEPAPIDFGNDDEFSADDSDGDFNGKDSAAENGIAINFNGQEVIFPLPENGRAPIFLDIAAAFSDDPTALLAHSSAITINGKIARLDEQIKAGDVIIIE